MKSSGTGGGGGMSLKERMLKYAAEGIEISWKFLICLANALDTAANFEKEMNEDPKDDEDKSSLMLNKTKRYENSCEISLKFHIEVYQLKKALQLNKKSMK